MVYIPQTKLDESFPAMEFNIDRYGMIFLVS